MSADTSAEAIGRLADALERSGLTIASATLRDLLAERDRLAEAVRALDAAHAQAAREVERLREALALISDAAPDGWHLNGVFVGQEARAALAGEGRGDG